MNKAIQAATMKAAGHRTQDIADTLGVKVAQAYILIRQGKHALNILSLGGKTRRNLCLEGFSSSTQPFKTSEPHYWHDGLAPSVVRLLVQAGYNNKTSVKKDVLAGIICLNRHPKPAQAQVALGKQSFHDLCAWLKLPPTRVASLLSLEAQAVQLLRRGAPIDDAITLLAGNGSQKIIVQRAIRALQMLSSDERETLLKQSLSDSQLESRLNR